MLHLFHFILIIQVFVYSILFFNSPIMINTRVSCSIFAFQYKDQWFGCFTNGLAPFYVMPLDLAGSDFIPWNIKYMLLSDFRQRILHSNTPESLFTVYIPKDWVSSKSRVLLGSPLLGRVLFNEQLQLQILIMRKVLSSMGNPPYNFSFENLYKHYDSIFLPL